MLRVCHPSARGKQEGESCISARVIREGFPSPEELGLQLHLAKWAGLGKEEGGTIGRKNGMREGLEERVHSFLHLFVDGNV